MQKIYQDCSQILKKLLFGTLLLFSLVFFSDYVTELCFPFSVIAKDISENIAKFKFWTGFRDATATGRRKSCSQKRQKLLKI